MQSKVIGLLLVLFGLLLLIVKFEWAPLTSFLSWPFLLFLGGALLTFLGFIRKKPQLVFLGTIMGGCGLYIWGLKYEIDGWPDHWSFIVVILGIAFLLQFGVSKNKSTALIGAMILLAGLFAWPGITDIPILAPMTSMVHSIWPIFIVTLGTVLLLKK
ncbi:hypothetical protein [Hazenella coriacea]|uniref:DUF5668 domain-containing protein n=1 Tax=Hazenella coriacea TaxID=1179467 RepID=A0A4R3L9N4_9BACL|nr:hypothetical protein [Hazenella coriacea]TCS96533.1 hypothetical protein EDD58_101167 [Hazenella coriacea]